MSKVYSFRLSEDNPREAQAMEVIKTRVSQGYSLRYLLTETLIKTGNNQDNSEILVDYIERLSDLVQEFNEWTESNDRSEKVTQLPIAFIDGVKKTAKQGIRNTT